MSNDLNTQLTGINWWPYVCTARIFGIGFGFKSLKKKTIRVNISAQQSVQVFEAIQHDDVESLTRNYIIPCADLSAMVREARRPISLDTRSCRSEIQETLMSGRPNAVTVNL